MLANGNGLPGKCTLIQKIKVSNSEVAKYSFVSLTKPAEPVLLVPHGRKNIIYSGLIFALDAPEYYLAFAVLRTLGAQIHSIATRTLLRSIFFCLEMCSPANLFYKFALLGGHHHPNEAAPYMGIGRIDKLFIRSKNDNNKLLIVG